MNNSILTRLEIDVMQINEIQEASELAFKYGLPAIIVHPNLSSDAIIARQRMNGKFKIITPIDWPKGEAFGTTKLRGITIDTFETDGFEFLLTPKKSKGDTCNEAKALTEFIKKRMSELAEIRFVIGTSMRPDENIMTLCEGMIGVPSPNLIRTDILTKTQLNKANADEHNRHITTISSIIRLPIKVSGNINSMKSMAACVGAAKFAVSLVQAKAIIKEYNSQPQQLQKILSSDE